MRTAQLLELMMQIVTRVSNLFDITSAILHSEGLKDSVPIFMFSFSTNFVLLTVKRN